jgi:hypothetical protein
MGTPLYMSLGDACELVQHYAELHTGNDVLAALKDMQMCYDDLDKEDKVAYNMFMDAGQRMFAPKQ